MFTTAFLQIYPVSLGFVFTEILRNRIDRNRDGFARFGFVWTGPKVNHQVDSGLMWYWDVRKFDEPEGDFTGGGVQKNQHRP
jgi:hypothetical protein